jgi:hypothetical protein
MQETARRGARNVYATVVPFSFFFGSFWTTKNDNTIIVLVPAAISFWSTNPNHQPSQPPSTNRRLVLKLIDHNHNLIE